MILPISDKYRLASDRRCWTVQEFRPKKSGDEWRSVLFFSDLSKAVSGLASLALRTSDAQTLADALAEVESISRALTRALAPEFEVKQREDAA